MSRLGVRILDRYVSRTFARIFLVTAVGFPVFTILIHLTDNFRTYLARDIPGRRIALAYAYGMVEQVFYVIPAAVLFATVFSVGALSRHSEITAAKASGIAFHRLVAPIFLLASLAACLTWVLGEAMPAANQRQAELLGEREMRSQTTRSNFVFRADGGRTYAIGMLIAPERRIMDVQIEREGTGPEFPGYFLTAAGGTWTDSTGWTLENGTLRIFSGPGRESALTFLQLRQAAITERPEDLLGEPKAPDQMNYAELGRYIRSLERSGSDASKLRTERALKVALPFTCLIIALFGAPLGLTGQRSGAAVGVALSLATTIVFLMAMQIARAIGSSGALPPLLATWTPNTVFGLAGTVLFARART
jgi:lipopolysaccharide export system permease protein